MITHEQNYNLGSVHKTAYLLFKKIIKQTKSIAL